ncbi:MAG: hypothetical protein FWC70_07815 [Defluviitaleaceae bacterium]|nr:hypothetical protein [Defluviitaleaceae bacterium]
MANRRVPPNGRRPGQAPRQTSRQTPQGKPRNPVRKTPKARTGMPGSARLVIGLFFAFVAVYMARGVFDFFQQDVGVMTLRLENIERAESVPAMIIRHEEVFFADKDGRVAFAVPDFERVRRGDPVASVMDVEEVSRLEQDMSRLSREIITVHEMRQANTTDPHVARVNASLQGRMDRHAHNNMQMNLSETYALLSTLSQITENRNTMITAESVDIRGDLSRRYSQLNEQFGLSSNDIYATMTGIMSPLVDGFEGNDGFTPDTMRLLNREQVNMSAPPDAIIPGREVYQGDAIFKIVGNTWYIAAWMPHEMAHGFAYGDNRAIYLESVATGRFERVPVRIYYLNPAFRDTFVIFRTTHNVAEFLNQRNVNLRLTGSARTGFTVPSSAIATRRFYRVPLTHIHGVENFAVMQRLETGTESISVQIASETATYAYILEDNFPLSPGDTLVPVLSDPPLPMHVLSDACIRIVRGIYRSHLNVASFVEVNIEGEVLDAGAFIVIDPARNTQIQQFHVIITDASMVRDGQVVR